jgi:hypothetical protein
VDSIYNFPDLPASYAKAASKSHARFRRKKINQSLMIDTGKKDGGYKINVVTKSVE